MTAVLRLVGSQTSLSARVFEENLSTLRPSLSLRTVPVRSWATGLAIRSRADLPGAGQAFRARAQGLDFISPDYEVFELSPLLVALRNAGDSPARFLLFAHSPAVGPFEWALLSQLLTPGDVVVAPTWSARDVIVALAPALAPRITVVPWPVPPVGAARAGRSAGKRVVTLTRMHPSKHLHRVLDAVSTAGPGLRVDVACATPSSRHARTLQMRAERLGLGTRFRLVPGIRTAADRGRLLDGASVVVNLSSSIEESFGKAVAEALTAGVPVLTTRWDGLPETVGAGGCCVPVEVESNGCRVVVDEVVEGLTRLLDQPPSEASCLAEGARFHPGLVGPALAAVLEDALHHTSRDPHAGLAGQPAATGGWLGSATALSDLSAAEAFDLHLEEVAAVRGPHPVATPAAAVRRALSEELSPVLTALFAHRDGEVGPPRRDLTRVSLLADRQEYAAACSALLAAHDDNWGELDGVDLVRLAQFARAWGRPGFALPWLRPWLDRYPDSPLSGEVWWQRARCAEPFPTLVVEAQQAFAAAERLLGADLPSAHSAQPPTVRRQGVRARPVPASVVGALFAPHHLPAPAVVVLAGSKGGLSPGREIAAELASRGFLGLGLAYFGCRGLPAELRQIPVEQVVEAVGFLAEHPDAGRGGVGVVGLSRGVELGLLAAVADDRVAALVSLAGSAVTWPAFTPGSPPVAAWTVRGVDVPFAPTGAEEALSKPGAPWLLPVERIAGPLLAVSGGADAVWPAGKLAEDLLRRRGHRSTDVHLHYPSAGHGVGPLPGRPPANRSIRVGPASVALGGSTEADVDSGVDAWPRIVAFLHAALSTGASPGMPRSTVDARR